MGTIQENRDHWNHYGWPQGGDEWSEVWGGPERQWWGAIFPRILGFLPAATILEIAPGFGRFTQFLAAHCERLIGVDLAERCVSHCRNRFQNLPHLEFHVNNGLTLTSVPDNCIDFAFSFDSLVHAEANVLRSYVSELALKLNRDGVAFFHHSNIGAFREPESDRIPFDNLHWRAESCSAELVRQFCGEASLICVSQELVNWGGTELTDAFSVVTRPDSKWMRSFELRENPGFMAEAETIGAIAKFYPRP